MRIVPDLTQVNPELERSSPKEMLSVSLERGKPKVRINSSSLSILQTCPRKAYYSLERGLKSKVENPATLFGSAIHKALEVFYSEPRENRNIPKNFVEHSDLMAFGNPAPEPHFLYRAIEAFATKAAPLRALPDSDKRSLASGVWVLQHYFKSYIDDPYEVYCDAAGPVTERPFSLKLYEDPEVEIEYFGTIDVVLKNYHTGVVLPADHKTSSMVGPDFYNRLKPNHQYTGYLYAAQKVLGIDTDSFLVNCLQVKPKPATNRAGPPNFPRQVTKRSEEDVQEFIDSVVHFSKEYLRWRRTSKWPLANVDACTYFSGCTYLDVCSAPSVIRETIIESKFNVGG